MAIKGTVSTALFFFDCLVHCFSVPGSPFLNIRYSITEVLFYFGASIYLPLRMRVCMCVLNSIISRFWFVKQFTQLFLFCITILKIDGHIFCQSWILKDTTPFLTLSSVMIQLYWQLKFLLLGQLKAWKQLKLNNTLV